VHHVAQLVRVSDGAHVYGQVSSAKAAWFHRDVLLMPCVIPVVSSSRTRALRNMSKRRGAISLTLWIRIAFAISRSWLQSYSSASISLTRRWMRPWNGAGACLKRSAGAAENPGALWEGILRINCEISLKVFTGSQIVSPIAFVRKSNIPALSRKVLSFVRCLVLRKFVGSVLQHVSPSQKCFMLRVGEGCSGMALSFALNRGPLCHIPNNCRWRMGDRRSCERRFRFLPAAFPPFRVQYHK